MRVGIILAALAVVGLVAAGGVMSMTPKRPNSLSIDIGSHASVLAVMRAIVNGAPIMKSSLRGRSQTGGLAYQSRFGANLSVQLMWYDITEERYYRHEFDLDVRDFSTFGEVAEHAYVKIIVGPGADITVKTPHPEGLRLVGLNRMDDITPEMDVDVVLAELCASVSPDDPSDDKRLRAAMGDDVSVGAATRNRDNWLSTNTAPQSRCGAEGTQ